MSSDEESFDSDVEAEQQYHMPQDIQTRDAIVGISCHPKRNLVASGTVSGPVHLHSFNIKDGNREVMVLKHHRKPCRAVHFCATGDHLLTAFKDGKVCAVDLETSSVSRQFVRDGGSPLYSVLDVDQYVIASGEEDGQVVLWDFRTQSPLQVFEDCKDYISSLTISHDQRTLVATSGDGTVAEYSVKGRKLLMRSEELGHEVKCSVIFKGGTKLAVGMGGDRTITIFDWDDFGNIDRFKDHPGSIESMAVYSEDVVCTGYDNGEIHAVQIFPNCFLLHLGTHKLPVESLSLNHDKSILCSSSVDQIKFWDTSGIEDAQNQVPREATKKQKLIDKQSENFFEDL